MTSVLSILGCLLDVIVEGKSVIPGYVDYTSQILRMNRNEFYIRP